MGRAARRDCRKTLPRLSLWTFRIALPQNSPMTLPSAATVPIPAADARTAQDAAPGRADASPVITAEEGTWTCPTCNAESAGRFCPACGERRLLRHDWSVRAFLAEAFQSVTSMDTRATRSFAALVLRPGLLTAEHLDGRRAPYVAPLQLFLLCNLVFFFVQPLTGMNVFSTPLSVHLNAMPYSELTQRLVWPEIARRGMRSAEYARAFDAASLTHARSLVVLMVPLWAVAAWAVFRRERAWYVQHLTFSFHVWSWILLLVSAYGLLLQGTVRTALAAGGGVGWLDSDALHTTLTGSLILAYVAFAGRRAYGGGWRAALARAAVLTACVLLVLQTYRFLLFFTVFQTL